jgi:polar amino acid transport system substrate-binding protein
MTRLQTWVAVMIASLLACLQAPAASQPVNYRLVNPGYLTVGTYGSGPPILTILPGDNLGGIDGALFNAFAKAHGLKLKLYQTTFASMILAIEQGKADVGEDVFYTAERAKHIYYTYPFYVGHAVLFTPKSLPYSGPDSMNGKKIGTVIGFVWAPYLQKWSASGAALFPDQAAVGQALLNGQIQGYINGSTAIHEPPLNDSPDVVAHALHPGDFGLPESLLVNIAYNIINCKNRGIAAALNEELARLHSNGEWAKILQANGEGPEADAPLQSPTQICTGG